MRYTIFLAALIIALTGCTAANETNSPVTPGVNTTANEETSVTPSKPEPVAETPKPTLTETPSTPKKEPEKPAPVVTATINLNVPFTSQAPTGEWDDERQQDGCEEASALMAMRWVQGKTSISATDARKEIVAISDYEQKTYGEFRDVSLADMKKWIFNDYFKYQNVEVKMNITAADIIAELSAGNVVLLPMNGQKLGNPNFTAPGPERHFIVVKGYDPAKKQFITNDPGTKRGQNYRYSEATIMNAILAYPSGHHEPVSGQPTGMLIVKK